MKAHKIRRYKDGLFTWGSAPLAEECRIDLLVNNRHLASVMATPLQLNHLAVGFLFGENIIGGVDEITAIEVSEQEVRVELKPSQNTPPRSVSLENIDPRSSSNSNLLHPRIDAAGIISLMEEFNAKSYSFALTGAVHSCCLIDGDKRYFADDVARHNALDKVIGRYLLEGPSGSPGLVLTTGRISTEILVKAAKAGLGLLISRSAATDRAVELARQLNMILVGFARGDRFNVYHGGEYIGGSPAHLD